MDDNDLVDAALRNESYAAPFLVSLYGPKLVGYCRSIAEDLSDTDREYAIAVGIERAVRRIAKYDRNRGPLLAWLRPFILHATQDWRRDHARLSTYDLNLIEDSPGQQSQPQPLPLIDAVRDAITQLSTADQIVIVLRDYEQRSVETVASILGIAPEACRQRHHRARKRLRLILAADERVKQLTGGSA